jgi:uncharacterized protein (TIGR02246 family)
MSKLTSRLVLPALLCLLSAAAFGQARSSETDAVVEGFVRAWNAHDMEAFGRLFAADADWVTASGVHMIGRDDIQAYLTQEHATWAKTTTMTATGTRLRRISEDIAIIFFQWQIAGALDQAGTQAAVARGNNVLVVTKQRGGWLIVAGQVASRRANSSSGQ